MKVTAIFEHPLHLKLLIVFAEPDMYGFIILSHGIVNFIHRLTKLQVLTGNNQCHSPDSPSSKFSICSLNMLLSNMRFISFCVGSFSLHGAMPDVDFVLVPSRSANCTNKVLRRINNQLPTAIELSGLI